MNLAGNCFTQDVSSIAIPRSGCDRFSEWPETEAANENMFHELAVFVVEKWPSNSKDLDEDSFVGQNEVHSNPPNSRGRCNHEATRQNCCQVFCDNA